MRRLHQLRKWVRSEAFIPTLSKPDFPCPTAGLFVKEYAITCCKTMCTILSSRSYYLSERCVPLMASLNVCRFIDSAVPDHHTSDVLTATDSATRMLVPSYRANLMLLIFSSLPLFQRLSSSSNFYLKTFIF